jgi:hypothetical protein
MKSLASSQWSAVSSKGAMAPSDYGLRTPDSTLHTPFA